MKDIFMDQITTNINRAISIPKNIFIHMSFEERVSQYNDEVTITDFDWGEPLGLELI